MLFALLKQFISFPAGRYTQLFDQASNWERDQKEKGGKFAGLLKKSEEWYVQVGMAILFLIGVKYIGNWIMNRNEPELIDDEEGLDEELQTPAAGRKFNIPG